MIDNEIAETHVSQVFLTPDYAIKFKKPVSTAFLDFSTPEARRHACDKELELNRRLAPDVYLDVAALSGPLVGIIDHAVVMRRLPAERSLAALATSSPTEARTELARVASTLARFHESARRGELIDEQATAQSLRRKVQANTSELYELTTDPHLVGMISAIRRLANRYLDGRDDLFRARIDEGRIVDGHGDLLASDVFCLEDGPRLLDCLEFSDDLRYGDVLADAAFLAMDLEHLGRPELAKGFLDDFALSATDSWPESLAHFYIACRAQIRAKVALLRGDAHDAESLLRLAVIHLEQAAVRIVLIGGAPATGKSSLTLAVATRSGAVIVRSDTVRKELAGVCAQHRKDPIGGGIYTEEMTRATYSVMIERARQHLARGESVVLDATWRNNDDRETARRLAVSLCADLVEFRCTTDRRIALRRAAVRDRLQTDVSDADERVVQALWDAGDPWPESIEIDTSERTTAEAADMALRAMHGLSLQPKV